MRVFEKRVLRRIFGAKMDVVTGEWRKIHNEEVNDMYCSPIFFRVIKSKRMRWAGHVARMGERRGALCEDREPTLCFVTLWCMIFLQQVHH